METYIDRNHQGYRPVAVSISDTEYEAIKQLGTVKIGKLSFSFKHWTKQTGDEMLDRVYITVFEGGHKFSGTYIHRTYSYNIGAIICSLQAQRMTEEYAQAFLSAIGTINA